MKGDEKSSDPEATVGNYPASIDSDEDALARMGYRQEFQREFTNLSTISFAFSIMVRLPARCSRVGR